MSQKLIMNLSDWIKAAALITQQKQEAATADTDQLSSMPLSQLAMDDSSPPVMRYGMHMPTATSTPTHMEVDTHSLQQENTYQQIIPGIPQGSLYPTLASLSSEEGTLPEKTQTLHDKVSKVWRNIYKMLNNVKPYKLTILMTILQVKMKNPTQKMQNRQFNFLKITKYHQHRPLLQTLR